MCLCLLDQTPPDISPSSALSANPRQLPLPLSLWGLGWAMVASSSCKCQKQVNEMFYHWYTLPISRELPSVWKLLSHRVGSALREAGCLISLSKEERSWSKPGRSPRSACQHWSIREWRAGGQLWGGGSRYWSATAFITCRHRHRETSAVYAETLRRFPEKVLVCL